MRLLNLNESVQFPQGLYTVLNLLREFVFSQDWSQDEASVASFDRIVEAIGQAKDGIASLEEKDFTVLTGRLRQVQFPAHASIELSSLRNRVIVKTPKVD